MLVCELAYVRVYILTLSKFFVTSIELRERCDNVIQRLAQTRARGGFKRKRNELAALMRHSESATHQELGSHICVSGHHRQHSNTKEII